MAVRPSDWNPGEILTASDLNDSLASKLPYAFGTATPSTSVDGFLWYDENDTPPTPKFWDGSAFQSIGAAFIGCSIKRENVSTAVTANTGYAVAMTTENFDTNSFHDNSTNNTRVTIPAGLGGKYLVNLWMHKPTGTGGSYSFIQIYKNGSNAIGMGIREGVIARHGLPEVPIQGSVVLTLAAGDYIEMYYQQGNTETVNMWFVMSAIRLGA